MLEEHKLENVFTPEDFNEDQQMVAKLADDFATNEIVPMIEKIEHKEWAVTRELLKKASDAGLTNADVPAEYGGSEMDKVSSALIADHIAKCGSFSVTYGAHSGIGTLPIVYFGTEEQKKKYLPRLASGEIIGAYALSESSSGSDAMNPRTKAVLSADKKALRSERREDVDHQRQLRRPVHRFCQGRRREIHGVHRRKELPGLLGGRGREEARHPRIFDRPADPE